jgi:hypothetical protein
MRVIYIFGEQERKKNKIWSTYADDVFIGKGQLMFMTIQELVDLERLYKLNHKGSPEFFEYIKYALSKKNYNIEGNERILG